MNCGLILDLAKNQDLISRNLAMGRYLAAYPLMAAKEARRLDRIYIATAAPEVKGIARQYSAIILDPPAEPKDWTEELSHTLAAIQAELKSENQALDALALLFSHVPTVTGAVIDSALDLLAAKSDVDWCLSVSEYSQFHPADALRETPEGLLRPYLDSPATVVQPGPVWYPDWGVAAGRASALASWSPSKAARPWSGKKVAAIKQEGGMPVDRAWQIPAAEAWLRSHGHGETAPALKPKPQAQAKPDRR